MDKKVERLIQLRMEIDGISRKELYNRCIREALETYHPYFGLWLNALEGYKEISYNKQTRTMSLTNHKNTVSNVSDEQMDRWKTPVKRVCNRPYKKRKKNKSL